MLVLGAIQSKMISANCSMEFK